MVPVMLPEVVPLPSNATKAGDDEFAWFYFLIRSLFLRYASPHPACNPRRRPMAATSPSQLSTPAPTPATQPEHSPPPRVRWPGVKYATPLLVLLLAVIITITRNWNSWVGGRIEQITDDAFVRDLTPLSTKVAGIVRSVKVADFQRCAKVICSLATNE